MRVALYARVSTKNSQDPETQLLALRDYAKARRLEVFSENVDVGISGGKDSRPALNELMADARKRRFDAVLVARFDRFARSTRHLVLALEEFNALGVDFISLSEIKSTPSALNSSRASTRWRVLRAKRSNLATSTASKRRFLASAISSLRAGLLSLPPEMPTSTYSPNTSSLRAFAYSRSASN